MLIDLFINAGWYTVPLKGKLERLSDGSKTTPGFPDRWREIYTEEFNDEKTKLAGAITGEKSGIIAIDCDNDTTYNIFKSLDPDYAFHLVSKGKPTGGGTIVYKYTPGQDNFRLREEGLELDFYGDKGFIYLPTENNLTKESWEGMTELPPLTEPPTSVMALLNVFRVKSNPAIAKREQVKHTISNRLAPMLENFVKAKDYDPVLFKIITPHSFRDLPTYVKSGHLHPRDVPKGRGSEYLSKISAILGADISVNIELYTNCIMLINSMKANPKEKPELMTTIINPMIEGRASVDGEMIWQYDPHWEKMGFIATTLNGDYIESFYDDVKGIYYLINYTVPYLKQYGDKRQVVNVVSTLLGQQVPLAKYDITKQLIRTSLQPELGFGHVEGTDRFNLFRQTEELAVINNPLPYKPHYNRPNTILNYFESLIPDDFMRQYVLSFLKTKLTTFKYSPVVLYLIGKSGSGKDTFVGIVRNIVGGDYIAKPDTKVFLEQYNGWMMDKYFVQLDEYGNKLAKGSEKQEALGKLKAYTGAPEMQVRAMRSDGQNYSHSATFILTANTNPLPIELEDRRVAFVKTPNILAKQDWVIAAGGISEVQDRIKEELMDFCYYLGTEVKCLPSDQYVIAPETADKNTLVLDHLPAAEQLVYYIQHQKYDMLLALGMEYGIRSFHDGWERSRMMDDKLQELYSAMTEDKGHPRTVIRMLKACNVPRQHTTKGGSNSFYYYLEGLHKIEIPRTEEQTVSAKNSGVKGLA